MAQPTDDEFCARIAQSLGVSGERCQPTTPLAELATDSLSQIEMSIDVQDEYEVIFTFDDLAALRTISDLAELVRQRKAEMTPTSS